MPKCFTRNILICIFVILFFMFHMKMEAKLIGPLEKILTPRSIIVYKNKAYIAEKDTIHIVSLESGKLMKSFGKKGEGPGEFKRTPNIRIVDDRLIVNSWGKIMYFDLDGNYQKERKHQFGRDTGAIPLGENFAAQRSEFSEKEQIALQEFGIYDQNFKLICKLFEGPSPNELDILPGNLKQPFPMITHQISMQVYNGNVYISDTRKGFYFQVFNRDGKRAEEIRIEQDPLKVGGEYKKKALEKLVRKTWWKSFKDKLDPVFPEYFPEIRFFTIRDHKIYVETHLEKGGKTLFSVYDLKTKKISEILLPPASDGSFARYDFDKETYYYLFENEDDDNWELHVKAIKFTP